MLNTQKICKLSNSIVIQLTSHQSPQYQNNFLSQYKVNCKNNNEKIK
jgi:hypothetical protein